MNTTVRTGLFLVILAVGASACTSLLGGFDFEGQTTGTGGTMTTGTGGGGIACTDPVKDCPAPVNECVTAICDANKLCAVSNVAVDGPVTAQTAGDCRKLVCDGNGATKPVDDNADINDDAKECTTDTCAAGVAANTPVAVNTACGAAGGKTKCDAVGNCVGCIDITDCGTPPACQVNTCTAGVCGTADATDASVCDDGNKCTQADSCQAGICTGSNPVVCTPSDQCHDPGTCTPLTGICSQSLLKGDGSACDDSDKCTKIDACLAGVCTGRNPVMCPVPDQCHDVAACVAATGLCPLTPKANGASCTDGNSCTQVDSCQAGTCTGASPVVCMALDECHNVGTCALATGLCPNPNKADGTPCANGTKTCMAGICG